MGAIFIAEGAGAFSARAAEAAAMKDAVRHACDPQVILDPGGTPPLG